VPNVAISVKLLSRKYVEAAGMVSCNPHNCEISEWEVFRKQRVRYAVIHISAKLLNGEQMESSGNRTL
jgi:hypothetical protein